MARRPDKPVEASAPADEAAAWVAAAEGLRACVGPSRASSMDYTWRSLHDLDRLIAEVAASPVPVGLRTRLGLAAYVGEVLIRQYGGSWATGEHYGEVLAPRADADNPKSSSESAHPTQMVERRLSKGDSLQHQVFEQTRAWGTEPGGVTSMAGVDGPAEVMRLAAEAFVKSAGSSGVTWLDYTTESVLRLDALIDKWWPSGPPTEASETMAPAMGAYLGEVLAMDTGARWVRDAARGFGLEHKGQVVFPATEVSRRLQLGPAQAIGQFYDEVSRRWHLAHEEKTTSRDRAGAGKRRGLFGRGRA